MARSEARDDGSYGLTLTTSTDPEDLADVALDPKQNLALRVGRFSVYVAGDVSGDPFDLGVGEAIDVKAELRVIAGARGTAAALTGELTVLSRRPVDSHVELLVQIDMVATSTCLLYTSRCV